MSDIGMINISDESATQQFALGTKYQSGEDVYRYAKFTAAIGAGDFAYLDKDYKTVEITTAGATKVAAVACVPYAVTTADYFGWVQTAGTFSGNTATSLSEGAKLYTSSTAGRLGANGGSDVQVQGATVTAATTAAGLNSVRAVKEMTINA